jgi:hypothetical protein
MDGDGATNARDSFSLKIHHKECAQLALHTTLVKADSMQRCSATGIPGAQSGWRWCKKCQGFFFSLNPAKGVCPADHTAHDDSASGHYFPSSLETPCPELKDCGVGVKNARDSSSQGIPPCVLQVARMTAVRAGNMEL